MKLFLAYLAPLCAASALVACGDSAKTVTGSDTTTHTDTTTTHDTVSTTDGTTHVDVTTTPDTASDATHFPDVTHNDATTTTDTSPGPDTVATTGAGTCIGMYYCLLQCPTDSQQAFQDCENNTCVAAANNQDEVAALQAYLTCQNNCFGDAPDNPTADDYKAVYACLGQNCVDTDYTCQGGDTPGAGTCTTLNTCLGHCPDSDDGTCIRACYEGATQDAGDAYITLDDCIVSQCITLDAQNVPSVDQDCATAAQQTGGACVDDTTACFGAAPTGGAAPGAGGGGGAHERWAPISANAQANLHAMRALRNAHAH